MKTIKTWLTTVAVLLCSMSMSAASYSDWTSTNKGQSNTTSSNSYTIIANAGDVLSFDWLVSSESSYDKLIITIGGTEILNKSGELSGTYQHTFTSSGNHTMVVKYTKDGSQDKNGDYAKVYNIALNTGNNSGDSNTENIVASGTCGDNITWKLHNDGTLTIEGTGRMTSFPWIANYGSEIKTVIIGEGVTVIGGSAFSGCSSLTTINIPESVTSIGNYAFYACSSLTSITIPKGVTSIGDAAFAVCSSLTSITIPKGVTSIGESAFYICSSLTTINIPESVTSIGNSAFSGCSSLTSITIPKGVTSIENFAFSDCNNLVSIIVEEGNLIFDSRENCNAIIKTETNELIAGCQSTIIPNSVTSIGESAFYICSSLTSITIPEGVTSIGQNTFSYTNLPVENNIRYAGTWAVEVVDDTKDKYTLRDNTTGIADNMFANCSMTEITLPNNLKYIGNDVCVNCRNLTSLTIPNSVTSIGNYAFMNCWSVTSLTIPSNVTSIGGGAFTGRAHGTSIVVDANNTVYDSRGNCNAIICTETNHLIAGCSTTIIPNSVTSIGERAFMNCGITSVIIPNGVTDIERDAFTGCRSLKTIICRNVVPPTCEANAFRDLDMGACALEVPLNSVAIYRETSPWSGFNISAIVPQTLVLNDGEVFENEENMIVEEITYIRNFKNTNWQALYVPFEIPVENIKDDFVVAYINDVHQFDDDDNGTIDRTQVEAIKMTGGTLKANYPYMIRAKVAGEKTITVTDAILYAAEENSIDCSSVFDTYTFTGTYSKIPAAELPKEEGYYALSGGAWKNIAAGTSLGAFRMYMKIDSRDASASVQARAIEMRVIGDDGVTAIENVGFNTPETRTATFDMQGRRVENPTKGLYIIDGKKVWIK